MRCNPILCLILLLCSYYYLPVQGQSIFGKKNYLYKKGAILVEMQLDQKNRQDSVGLTIDPLEKAPGINGSKTMMQKVTEGNAKWRVDVENPVSVYIADILGKQYVSGWAEPGDSIVVRNVGERFLFSGRGAEKFILQQQILTQWNSIKKPSNLNQFNTKSLDDFLEWNTYLNNKLESLVNLIDSYKSKISSIVYNNIKFRIVGRIEEDRLDKFTSLRWKADKFGLTNQNLCDLFDSTFFGPHAKWMRTIPMYHGSYYAFTRTEVWRKFKFNNTADSLKSASKRLFLYYEHGKKKFKGLVLEEFFLRLIRKQLISEIGFTPETEILLARYYAEPGYPEYKNYVKEHELRERVLKSGKPAPDFKLTDVNGKSFTKDNLKGKITLMDFWFTGCAGCVHMTPILHKVENAFKDDSNVVFLNISADKDKLTWQKSIEQRKFTTGEGINLYTGGQGYDHEMIKSYRISTYPSIFLLDAYGTVLGNPLPDPRHDNGEQLIKLIRQQLMLLKDGPYVVLKDNFVTTYSINGRSVIEKSENPNQCKITVQTDEFNKTFNVLLKHSLQVEPSEFPRTQKLFALSDIEGNFSALRNLLQSNKVIDKNYNWVFGDGHLVFNGDMFDRGEQVTECLWLIYSLEEKAKAAGGYVHFILGNHEIMNLSGDTRYVQEKYKINAKKIGKSYAELYNRDTELGKWLRSKNIMEKIGDLLFTHAGLSKEISRLPLTIKQINAIARPYYDKDSLAKRSTDEALSTLYDSKLSPFWYRLYYQDAKIKIYTNGDTIYKPTTKDINAVLEKYGVSQIITGHTIIADTISVHYDGKVINIDTRHSQGESEALLVEGNQYYRVNGQGKKVLLNLKTPKNLSHTPNRPINVLNLENVVLNNVSVPRRKK